MQGYNLLKSFLIPLSILSIILLSNTVHAKKFNKKDQDTAFDYYIQLILDGDLPISNFIYTNNEWLPCNFKRCLDQAEENLINIFKKISYKTNADQAKALILEKELRRLQTYSKTDFKKGYLQYKKIEGDFVDLFSDDFFELASFYAYLGSFSMRIDSKSDQYLNDSIKYFKLGIEDEYKTDDYSKIDWQKSIGDSDLQFLYIQKMINDFTYANTALIMNSIQKKNNEYQTYKEDLIKLYASLPKTLMWTFDRAEDYYLHSIGSFEFQSHVQVGNVEGMKQYLNQLEEYCNRTLKKRENNVLMQADDTTDNCRNINLYFAQLLLLEDNKDEAKVRIENQFHVFEKMSPDDQLTLLRLLINEGIYSLLPVKDMYEMAISIASKMGLNDYSSELSYWTLDYLYLLRSGQNLSKFLENKNNLYLYKNIKISLENNLSNNDKEFFYEEGKNKEFLSLFYHIDASIAELEYANLKNEKNIFKIKQLLKQSEENTDLLLDWRSKLSKDWLISSLLDYYVSVSPNYNEAHRIIDKILAENENSLIHIKHKNTICSYEKNYECSAKYLKQAIKIEKELFKYSMKSEIGAEWLLANKNLVEDNFLLATNLAALNDYKGARKAYLDSLTFLLIFSNVPSDDLVETSFNMVNDLRSTINIAINEILLIDSKQDSKLSSSEFGTLFMATQFLQNSNVSKAAIQMTDRMSFENDKIKKLYRIKQDLEHEVARIRNELEDSSINIINAEYSKELTKHFNVVKKELRETNELLKSSLPFNGRITVNKLAVMSDLQSQIKKNEAILIYHTKGEYPFSWIITNDNYVITPLNDSDLNKKIKLVRQSIDNKIINQEMSFDYEASEKLYLSLIKPIEFVLENKKRIFVISDGELMTIPLDILPNKSKFNAEKNNWLIKKYSITNLPNIDLVNQRDLFVKDFNKLTFLGVGDPKLSDKKVTDQNINEIIAQKDFLKNIFRDSKIADISKLNQIAELPETTQELIQISSYFNTNNVDLLLRDDANESKLKRLQLDKYNILSFATHTIPSTEENRLSEPGLLLSIPNKASYENDGILTASEITQMTLKADLVVLSACNTAQNIDSNNTISGLIDSFIYAGSKAIIASHWPVESNSTVTLMTTTFDNWLGNGLNLDEALQKAKLDIMTKKEYSHPMYWASFSIYGGL